MTPEREKIFAKIKKCLALSKSSNEHEASAALRQAQKLMDAYNISDLDIAAAEVEEAKTRAGAGVHPAKWEAQLALWVADVFGCESIFTPSRDGAGYWKFIGVGPAAEIAQYTFDVFFRQLKRARAEYIKTRLKRCKTATKTRRADLFCEGWVATVFRNAPTTSGAMDGNTAIKAYMETRYPTLDSLKARNRTGDGLRSDRAIDDYMAGQRSGKTAQLHQGVKGGADRYSLPGAKALLGGAA
ncbi:MAG: DUF2786 domain-containing protein [Zoogloeaceae bacterium]|jgi:hypothetical protein|nr:DUF2786 domain-containing protein [Zoogloeaceae bacterium]